MGRTNWQRWSATTMARCRNIKPEFFMNERLADCSPLSRLLFAGLWTIADKAGRVEDRPKRIKVAVLPYDDCDCDKLLSELHEAGFIIRYESDGVKCLWIPNFERHQRPHPKEQESALPAYTEVAVELHGEKLKETVEPENKTASCAFPSSNPHPFPSSNPHLDNASQEKFRLFWDSYPENRDGKKPDVERSRRAFALLPPHQQDQVIQAVPNYNQSSAVADLCVMTPLNFIENGWPDWLEPPKARPPNGENKPISRAEMEEVNRRHQENSNRQRRAKV